MPDSSESVSRGIGTKQLRLRPKMSNYAISIPIALVIVLLLAGVISQLVDDKQEAVDGASITPITTQTPGTGPSDPGSGALSQLIVDSIVQVVIVDSGEPCSVGSGSVVIDGNYVLTNHHVVADYPGCSPEEISIRTVATASSVAEATHIATVVASDENSDIAILKIESIDGSTRKLKPLVTVQSDEVGEELTVVGFPAICGNSATVSRGILSGFKTLNGIQWIKTDALISGGNSGGAALTQDGYLLGIPTMYSESDAGDIVDCRNAADTNGDGYIDRRDQCVTTGGTIGLIAPVSAFETLAQSAGLKVRP